MKEKLLHPDRLFSPNPDQREIARRLYGEVKDLPIVSPHGHTDPAWFAQNLPFKDPVELFIKPDHYLYRMLYSQGIPLEELGIGAQKDSRKVWKLFCDHYYLFRGTPSRLWLEHAFYEVCGVPWEISPENGDRIFDYLTEVLAQEAFRPRALFETFNIELLCTTESPLDPLEAHDAIQKSGWYQGVKGQIITSFRPDCVVDPEFEGFRENIEKLALITGVDTSHFQGYLEALRKRRRAFIARGATATDHGHPTAQTADLSTKECTSLYGKALKGELTIEEAELFRGQMVTEMAKMSLEDGLVLQLHAGAFRNHNRKLFDRHGRDRGADIPTRTDFVHALKPLLDRFGNERNLTVILFTLDETAYSRELAPLAGHYPILKLGPPWWFFDSVEGMRRFRQQVTETAGFYNTAGFNDDTRAFFSIPARHDLARRVDCNCLAEWVLEHRISESDAFALAPELACGLARKSYRLQPKKELMCVS